MIPDLALIITCYVNTRFFQLILTKPEGDEHPFVKLLAGISILIALYCMVDILNIGSHAAPGLPIR